MFIVGALFLILLVSLFDFTVSSNDFLGAFQCRMSALTRSQTIALFLALLLLFHCLLVLRELRLLCLQCSVWCVVLCVCVCGWQRAGHQLLSRCLCDCSAVCGVLCCVLCVWLAVGWSSAVVSLSV